MLSGAINVYTSVLGASAGIACPEAGAELIAVAFRPERLGYILSATEGSLHRVQESRTERCSRWSKITSFIFFLWVKAESYTVLECLPWS